MSTPVENTKKPGPASGSREPETEHVGTGASLRHEEFEDIVAEVMTRFLDATDELNAFIEQSLSEIGAFLGVSKRMSS